MAGAFEAILQLRTERFNRAGTRWEAFGGIVLVVETVAIGLKILDFPLDQIAEQALEFAGFFAQGFQGFDDLLLLAMTQLMEQRLDPLPRLGRLGIEIAGYIPEVLGGVVEVQFLDGPNEAILDDVPNPQGPITDDKNISGLGHAPAQGLGMHLAAELFGFGARRGGHPELFQDLSSGARGRVGVSLTSWSSEEKPNKTEVVSILSGYTVHW